MLSEKVLSPSMNAGVLRDQNQGFYEQMGYSQSELEKAVFSPMWQEEEGEGGGESEREK